MVIKEYVVEYMGFYIYYLFLITMNTVHCNRIITCTACHSIPQLQSDWSLSCDHGLDYAS